MDVKSYPTNRIARPLVEYALLRIAVLVRCTNGRLDRHAAFKANIVRESDVQHRPGFRCPAVADRLVSGSLM